MSRKRTRCSITNYLPQTPYYSLLDFFTSAETTIRVTKAYEQLKYKQEVK